ncbi:MAG: ATP-binding cassette domain-containing protein, partial [Bacteroidetes bacterium]|nr:ATP-binding cassette domain-containing protein [Bacteroidota bacterium]
VSSIKRKDVPFLRRKIGIVFQDFQLLTDRTVKNNLLFIMKATGWKKKKLIEKRLVEILELVGLSNKAEKFPHELSGGEQQRVVIARALINEPFVILADEPTGNLDPQTSKDILDLLAKISESGTAILMATHNYNLIKYYPSRVMVVADQTLAERSPDNLSM